MEKNEGRRRETLPPSKEERGGGTRWERFSVSKRTPWKLPSITARRSGHLVPSPCAKDHANPWIGSISRRRRQHLSRGTDRGPISSGHFAIFHSACAFAPCNPILRLTMERVGCAGKISTISATRRDAMGRSTVCIFYGKWRRISTKASSQLVSIVPTFLRVQPTLDNGACADNILLHVESSISEFCSYDSKNNVCVKTILWLPLCGYINYSFLKYNFDKYASAICMSPAKYLTSILLKSILDLR